MKPEIGIQLYTLRDHIKTPENFDSTLKRLSEMGVGVVQISAIGSFPASVQKQILDKYNMKVCVTHKPFEDIVSDTDRQISEHKIIDCDSIGLGSAPEKFRGNSGRVRDFIKQVRGIEGKLGANGMTFNYHNHNFEFYRMDDMACTMMDLLLDETDPAFFKFIPDVAWIHYAGADPVEVLEKMRGRVKVVHFKDYIIKEKRERHFVSLGKGTVNLEQCYEAACRLEIPYIMYEQDDDWTDGDPFKATEESWEFLKKLQ